MRIFELYVQNQPAVLTAIENEIVDAVEVRNFEKLEVIELALRSPALFPNSLKFKKSSSEQDRFNDLFQKTGETTHGRSKYTMKCKTPMSLNGLSDGLGCLVAALRLAASMDEYFPSRILKKIQQG